MLAPYRRCRCANAVIRARSAAWLSSAGVYRKADALMPRTASARRSLRPRSVMLRTTRRCAGAITTFGGALRGSPRSRGATPPTTSSAGSLRLEHLQEFGVRHAHPAELVLPEVPSENPCFRHRSLTATPASASRRKPTICASVNRFFIVRSLSLGPDSRPTRYSQPGMLQVPSCIRRLHIQISKRKRERRRADCRGILRLWQDCPQRDVGDSLLFMSDPRTDAREASTSPEASVGLSASQADDKKGAEHRNSYAGLVVSSNWPSSHSVVGVRFCVLLVVAIWRRYDH